ncbi:MAG: S8 family serine peptidase [Thiohalocapsa sp.]|jgi:hypothetical protein|uniref:S8 family peptidase n=1 Tax=Thiohalocapsa sp. TaxID=2497641 RepID=UPI0025DEFA85|nr:S8 family serine peptidase [Thiohalocapsa sp.]MCG6942997.1 S8 family serine peptidase [Thiohalocapsa sp.]
MPVGAAPMVNGVTKPTANEPAKLTQGIAPLMEEYQTYVMAAAAGTGAPPTFRSTRTIAEINDGYVVIDAVAAGDVERLRMDLQALGATITGVAGRMISAKLPLERMDALQALDSLRFARPAMAATHAGIATSQGDSGQLSDAARATFDVDGTGVMIGVLSDSFDCSGNGSYASDLDTGDLPAGIEVLDDTSPSCTDEGRAMLQLIHDVAPGAKLAFHTSFNGEAGFAQGIRDLQAAGANVIVDDANYLAEPFFQDGVVAQAIDEVTAKGVSYFSSAGNSARQSYAAPFRPSTQTILDGTLALHDFDPGPGEVVWQQIDFAPTPVTTVIPFSLQWSDPFFTVSGEPGAASDLDLCVSKTAGEAGITSCTASDNQGGDPVEVFAIRVPASTTPTTLYFAIGLRSGPEPTLVKYIWFKKGVQKLAFATNSPTIYGHANAAGTNAVGASAYYFTPELGQDPPLLNDFSSAGGTPILFETDGAPTFEVRNKPDFTAPDDDNTTFFGTDIDMPEFGEPDGFPNFSGTSAAASNAAAVAALMLESDASLTPVDITAALQATATDILNRSSGEDIGEGQDEDSGAGLINAIEAVGAARPSASAAPNPVGYAPGLATR